MVKDGGTRDVAGNIVPVSIGNSSASDTDEETRRILAQLRQYNESMSHGSYQDDGIQVSSSLSSSIDSWF